MKTLPSIIKAVACSLLVFGILASCTVAPGVRLADGTIIHAGNSSILGSSLNETTVTDVTLPGGLHASITHTITGKDDTKAVNIWGKLKALKIGGELMSDGINAASDALSN